MGVFVVNRARRGVSYLWLGFPAAGSAASHLSQLRHWETLYCSPKESGPQEQPSCLARGLVSVALEYVQLPVGFKLVPSVLSPIKQHSSLCWVGDWANR